MNTKTKLALLQTKNHEWKTPEALAFQQEHYSTALLLCYKNFQYGLDWCILDYISIGKSRHATVDRYNNFIKQVDKEKGYFR